MDATFAAGARRLAGVAGLLLGWRPDVFWDATPDELGAVLAAARGEDGAAEGVDRAELGRLVGLMPD